MAFLRRAGMKDEKKPKTPPMMKSKCIKWVNTANAKNKLKEA